MRLKKNNTKKHEYLVVLHPAEEGGYWGEAPALPGCYSQGETLDQALAHMREAIASHLQALTAFGETIPTDEGFIISRVTVG